MAQPGLHVGVRVVSCLFFFLGGGGGTIGLMMGFRIQEDSLPQKLKKGLMAQTSRDPVPVRAERRGSGARLGTPMDSTSAVNADAMAGMFPLMLAAPFNWELESLLGTVSIRGGGGGGTSQVVMALFQSAVVPSYLLVQA